MYLILVLLLVLWFWNDQRKYSKCPPGPLRLPILGNIPQITGLSSSPPVAFTKLAKKYGDIMFVRIGFTNVILFQCLESFKQIRTHEFCQGRGIKMVPNILNRCSGKNLGIAFSSGNSHSILRSFVVRKLREFGMGKSSSMDHRINEEFNKFANLLNTELNADNETVIDNMGDFLFVSISSIVNQYTVGISYDYNDSKIKKLLKLNYEFFQANTSGMSPANAYPFLYDLFPGLFGKNEATIMCEQLAEFLRDIILKKKAEGKYQLNPDCLLDEFLIKMEKDKEDVNTVFTEEQLIIALMDLFQAGTDTTSGTINFCLLYMIIHQEIQEQVQNEIDSNIADDDVVCYETRKKLPFTHATFLECIRYCTNVPTIFPHVASADFYFKGFLIKKDTYLIGNIHSVNFSEKFWGDPHIFRPERFLKSDGSVDLKKANILMPFGCGNRICVGMSLADPVVFIYFASLLRKYKFTKIQESDVVSIVPTLGLTNAPRPYRMKITRRHLNGQ